MILKNILEDIGNTPILKLNKLYDEKVKVWIKLERNNPGGSIKDRIALYMIEDAERKGILNPNSIIVEPTSGNTGVGLSMVGVVKGYRVILTMPESMSIERRRLMSAYGAELVLTPAKYGMKGAIDKAHEIVKNNQNTWMPSQFDNKANIAVHSKKTAQEILKDFPNGFDYIITGVGTGGHITGVAEVLKKRHPLTKVFAVEPEDSPVISGGKPGGHPIQGIGAGFIPKNLHTNVLDGVITVSHKDAFSFAKKVAKSDGLLAGISTGASLTAVNKKISEVSKDSTFLTFNYDTGERYLSIDGLF